MKKRKLVLSRETIRPLRNGDLLDVVGGSGTNACVPATRNGCNVATTRGGWASIGAPMCGGSVTGCNVGPSLSGGPSE